MTKPPCKRDGVDCTKRHVGCRKTCPEWKEWESVHAAEKKAEDNAQMRSRDVLSTRSTQRERIRAKQQADYQARKRNGL